MHEASGPPEETNADGPPTDSTSVDDGVEVDDGQELDLLAGVVDPSDREGAAEEGSPTDGGDSGSGEAPRPARRRDRWGFYVRWSNVKFTLQRDGKLLRERDPEENESSRLPPNERIEVPAIWITELYTPSTVAGLFNGLHDLDWEQGAFPQDDLAKWMSDVRHGRTAGWTNLGTVGTKSKPRPFQERTADLPVGVELALPTLMSITPSVSALVIAFVLDDSTAAVLDGPLRADYVSFSRRDPRFRWRHVLPYVLWSRPIRRGCSYHTPESQRRDAAGAALDDIEGRCAAWMRRQLPGAFASGLRGGLYPTGMLFVSDGVRPLTEDARRIRALEGPGLDREYDSWQSSEWPGCLMALPHAWRKEELRLLFGCCRGEAFPDAPGYPEPRSNTTIAYRANELIRGLLGRWALSCLLDGFHQLVSAERDRSARSARYRSVRDLHKVRQLLRTDIYDVRTSAREIRELANSKRRFAHDVLEMEYSRQIRGRTIGLLPAMRRGQTARATQVERDSDLLLSTLASSADLTQAISQIRLQRRR